MMFFQYILGFIFIYPIDIHADAISEGQAFVESQNREAIDGLKNKDEVIAKIGIAVDPNPKEATYKTSDDLKNATRREADTNDFLKSVRTNHEKRPIETFTVDDNPDDPTELVESTGTFTQKCYRSGESYTKTCIKHRVIELKLTPEVKANHSKYCLGHWNWSGTSKSHCGGCKGGDSYVKQARKIDVIKDEWVGCEELEALDGANKADVIDEVVIGAGETKTIKAYTEDKAKSEDEPITRDGWEIRRTYRLNVEPIDTCKPLKIMGCTDTGSVCLEEEVTADGVKICKKFEHTYQCRHSTTGSTTGSVARTVFDDKNPIAAPKKVSNQRMFEALSKLEGLNQMAKAMEGSPVVSIFKGDVGQCTTNFGGSFKNCCERSGGFGTRIGLARDCSADEMTLAGWRSEKRCVFIGSRRKNNALGINFSSEKVFCCFPNKIARAIQEQGRSQLGLNFGSADAPNCRGLTPEELKRVDFSRIDLSEAFSEIATSTKAASLKIKADIDATQKSMKTDIQKESIKTQQETIKRGEY